jgi:hypothetical protein
VDATLESLTPERLRALVTAALPDGAPGALRLAVGLRRGEGRTEELLPVPDLAEPVEARVRRYHALTEAAYGVRPAPHGVRVTRLLVRSEEEPSAPALPALLRATFRAARERWAAAPAAPVAGAVNGTRQLAVESLAVDAALTGPALVVLPGATAFVPAGMPYHVDGHGNLVLETRA